MTGSKASVDKFDLNAKQGQKDMWLAECWKTDTHVYRVLCKEKTSWPKSDDRTGCVTRDKDAYLVAFALVGFTENIAKANCKLDNIDVVTKVMGTSRTFTVPTLVNTKAIQIGDKLVRLVEMVEEADEPEPKRAKRDGGKGKGKSKNKSKNKAKAKGKK